MDIFDVFELDSNSNSNSKRKANQFDAEENGEIGKDNFNSNDNIDHNLIDQLMNSAKKFKEEKPDSITIIETSVLTNEVEKFAEDIEQFMPQVTIHELDTKSSCLHEVVIPNDLEYVPLRDLSENNSNYKPAKEYKFMLDPFQKEAILCIENNQSVLGKFIVMFSFIVYYCLFSNQFSFGPHISWKNCSSRICDCIFINKQTKSDLYYSNQSFEQSEI